VIPEEIFELCSSLIRVQGDRTVVLSHFSVKEYLLCGYLVGKEPRLAKFALKTNDSWRYVSKCILSYTISVGMRVRDLQRDRFDEDEFPLCTFICTAEFSRFQDFTAVDAWMKQHLLADRSVDWLLLLDCDGPLAPHGVNFQFTWCVQKILHLSLMCFWNGNIKDVGSATDTRISSAVEKVARLFLRLQHSWERPENSQEALRFSGMSFATFTPLCAAASFGYNLVLRVLLDNGALINGISSIRFAGNPLSRALEFGNKRVACTLLELGANVNIRMLTKSHGCTALTSAAKHSSKLVEYLLDESKVNTYMVDDFGRTFVSNNLPRLNYPDSMIASTIG